MCREIRSWHCAKRSARSLGDLALMFNSIVRVDQLLRALLPLPVAPLPTAAQRPPGPVACRKYHKRLRNRERRAMELLAGAAGAQDLEDPAQWRVGDQGDAEAGGVAGLPVRAQAPVQERRPRLEALGTSAVACVRPK
jgi:hypothetical protein